MDSQRDLYRLGREIRLNPGAALYAARPWMIVGSLCGVLLVGVDWFWPLVGLGVGVVVGGIDSTWEYLRLRNNRVVVTETAIELWCGRNLFGCCRAERRSSR